MFSLICGSWILTLYMCIYLGIIGHETRKGIVGRGKEILRIEKKKKEVYRVHET